MVDQRHTQTHALPNRSSPLIDDLPLFPRQWKGSYPTNKENDSSIWGRWPHIWADNNYTRANFFIVIDHDPPEKSHWCQDSFLLIPSSTSLIIPSSLINIASFFICLYLKPRHPHLIFVARFPLIVVQICIQYKCAKWWYKSPFHTTACNSMTSRKRWRFLTLNRQKVPNTQLCKAILQNVCHFNHFLTLLEYASNCRCLGE